MVSVQELNELYNSLDLHIVSKGCGGLQAILNVLLQKQVLFLLTLELQKKY